MTLPPSPQSLFSVDIPSDFIEEFEDHMNRERVYWRGRAREARNRRLMEERSAVAPLEESPSRLSGKAVSVAAGSGPRGLKDDQPAAALLGKSPDRPEVRFLLFNPNNLIIFPLQSSSSDSDPEMTYFSDVLDRKAALESRWGGPGEIRNLVDDGVALGPGEEEHERHIDEWIERMIVLEETRYFRLQARLGSSEE